MAKTLTEKKKMVEEIKEKLSSSKSAVLTDYRGLNVEQITELRKQLREAGVDYKVLKNTMVIRAAKELDMEFLNDHLVGPTAIAFGIDDAVAPAKILSQFAKNNKDLELKAGVLDGSFMDKNDIKALADLPSREVLLGKVVGGMQAPISGLVNVLNGPIRGLAYALQAIKDKKEAS